MEISSPFQRIGKEEQLFLGGITSFSLRNLSLRNLSLRNLSLRNLSSIIDRVSGVRHHSLEGTHPLSTTVAQPSKKQKNKKNKKNKNKTKTKKTKTKQKH